MRLLHASTGLAAAAALALTPNPPPSLGAALPALALLAAWTGSLLLTGRREGSGKGEGEGSWIRIALALALAWRAPGGPAAALIAALLLEVAAARLTARFAARSGAVLPGIDLHSLILAGGTGADLVAAAAFAALILWPDGLPVIASALAGLTAMGAIARTSLAVAVMRGAREET